MDILLNPIPWYPTGTYKTSYVEEFNKLISDICAERDGVYVDIFNPFKNEDLKVLLSPDGIHPSTVGHKVIYEKVKDVLADKGWA